jgi:hypothetical protein
MDGVDVRSSRCRAQIEFCIDAFVEETGYIPASAREIRDPTQLSPSLELLIGALDAASAWRAWDERGRGWFIQGRLIDSGATTEAPTAHLIFRDHRAHAIAAGVWCRGAPARWDLVEILAPGPEATTA